MGNPVVWFDIPVSDVERAKTFYQAVMGVELANMVNSPNQNSHVPLRARDGVWSVR